MTNKKIIFKLTVQDIQNVAEENFGRKLTSAEIDKIQDSLDDKISWYDVIYDSISEKLNLEELN